MSPAEATQLTDPELLSELKFLAMDIARNLAGRIPKADHAHVRGIALAFDRLALTVRRIILLSDHIAKLPNPESTRVEGRKQILREVGDAIAKEKLSSEQAEALRVELVERVEAPELAVELDREILAGRVRNLIKEIKSDFGLGGLYADTNRRTPDDIAEILIRAHKKPIPWPNPPHPSG